MRLGRDGIAGLIGLAVSLLLLPQALSLPKLPIVPVGPGFYPTIVFVFLGLTSAVLLAQDILAQRRAGSVGAAEIAGRAAARLRPGGRGFPDRRRLHRASAAHRLPHRDGAVRCSLPAGARQAAHASASGRCSAA